MSSGLNARGSRPRSASRTRSNVGTKENSVGGARGIRALRKNREPEQENMPPASTTRNTTSSKSARVDAARAYLAENVDPLMAEIINFLLSNQPLEADKAILAFLEARRNSEEYNAQPPPKRSSDRNAVLRDRQYMARTVQPVLERLMRRVVEDQPSDVEAHFIKQLKLDPLTNEQVTSTSQSPSQPETDEMKTSLTNRVACDALFRMIDEKFAGKLSPQEIRDNIRRFKSVGVPMDSLATKFWLNVAIDIEGEDKLDKSAFYKVMNAVASSSSLSFRLSSFYAPLPTKTQPSKKPIPSEDTSSRPIDDVTQVNASPPKRTEISNGLTVGTPVTVNYKKSGNFYPGKISAVRADGNYDIAYDDGDSEVKVPMERIQVEGKQIEATSTTTSKTEPPKATETVGLNSRVEVNYKKSGNFFVGSVAVVNANGTFNIAYDDGDSENHVPLERIRLLNPITAKVIHVPGSASSPESVETATIATAAPAQTVSATDMKPKAPCMKPVIALVGISGGGKSTLLKAMSGDPDPKPRPTTGFSQKKLPFEVQGSEVTVHWYDLPGSWTSKWEGYLTECHGVVFVADSTTSADEAESTAKAFQETMNGAAAHGKPLLVLANKQDVEGARGVQDVSKLLGISDEKQNSSNCIHVIGSTVHPERNGGEFDARVEKGLEWLLEKVASQYGDLNDRVEKDAAAAAEAAREEKIDRHRRVFTKLLKEKAFPEEGEPMETFSKEDSYEFLAMELLIHDPQNSEKTRTPEEFYGLSEVARHVIELVGCQKMAMIMVADMINPENKKTKTTHTWDEVVSYIKDRREDAGLSRDLK